MLERRWEDSNKRSAWCEMVVAEAADTLAADGWIIEHPDAWTATDREAVVALAAKHNIPKPAFQSDPSIKAGLRIRVGSATLDGTATGLLTARHAVEGLLLACWEDGVRSADG